MKLTKTEIAKFQIPPGKTEHWEPVDGIPNFYLRCIGQSKLLVHSYKYAGKPRKTSFGSATKVNISKTCEAARDLNAPFGWVRTRLAREHPPSSRRDKQFGRSYPGFSVTSART